MTRAAGTAVLPAPGRRRILLGALSGCAALAAYSRGLRAETAAGASFALTPAPRAHDLSRRVAPETAADLLGAARKSLARPLHLMTVVRTAGLLDGEGERGKSRQAQEDWRQARLQALAWRLSGDKAHLDSAKRYVFGWAASYQPCFSPIDETELSSLVFAFDLIQEQAGAAELAQMQSFCRTLASGYLSDKILVGGPSTGKNNWHSHRIKLGAAAAFVSGDGGAIAAARIQFMRHLPRNIHPGGLTFDFEQRDALHYVTYTLAPLLASALMAKAHGDDWYAAQDAQGRLGEALDWLAPYALGRKTHEEFARSQVPFDRRRAAAGAKGFSGLWQRSQAATVYLLAARLDARYRPISSDLPAPPWAQALYL